MKHVHPVRFAASRGFTLVESIIVLVVLGIAAVGIISLQSQIFSGQSDIKNIQIGVQLMQECAEQVLATRRASASGYGDVNSTNFNTTPKCGTVLAFVDTTVTPNKTYSIPSVEIDPYIGAGCPTDTDITCKRVLIRQDGLTPITLMLVSYY